MRVVVQRAKRASYGRGLGAQPPAGSRGGAPGGGLRGGAPREIFAKIGFPRRFLVIKKRVEKYKLELK